MPNLELNDYIAKLRSQNIPDAQIKDSLLSSGWPEQDIIPAMYPPPSASFATPSIPSSVTSPVSKGSTSMWDAFEHILLFISLYVLSISIALILHDFVDRWFPRIDEVKFTGSSYWRDNILRGYIAALIVSYPLFAFFFWRVTKHTLSHPALRQLKSRKFLIYFTLVVTFLIMISSIISTIYSFLSGNLTLNFILHLLVTLIVTGAIFAYYLHQVREDRQYAKV